MEVVLLKDDVNLGDKGAVVNVSAGHARNFLLPNGIARKADASMKKHIETIKKQRQKKLGKEMEAKKKEVEALQSKEYVIKAKAGEGKKLYGAITHAQVAEVVSEQSGLKIDKRKVHTEGPIKKVGEHEVTIKYYPELDAKIKVKIEAEAKKEEQPKE